MAEQALITLEEIKKTYTLEGQVSQVLKGLSFKVGSGEMLAILGASGSGKSSLMNIIGLLDQADGGRYFFRDQDVSGLSDDARAALRNQAIGFVFQQFHLLTRMNAFQNIELPLIYANIPQEMRKLKVESALAKVGMSAFAKHKPTQLSGGQQQRIAIARAIVNDPQLILADEPTGALDSKTGQSIMALFHQMNAEGNTLIIVTHDESVAAQCSARLSIVDGEMITGKAYE